MLLQSLRSVLAHLKSSSLPANIPLEAQYKAQQMAKETMGIRAVIARAAWRALQRVLLAAPLSLPTNPGSWSMCFQHVRPCDVVVFRCWVVTKSPACPP